MGDTGSAHEIAILLDLSIPGLVNVYIANWKITMLLMGKLTISMAMFNSYVKLPEGRFHRMIAIHIQNGGHG